ncbi:MAG: hypothetical protein AB7I04_06120 [Pseudomonadales bacterium]
MTLVTSATLLVLLLASLAMPARSDLIENWIASFVSSDIVFARGKSNVPFQPLGWLDVSYYRDTDIELPSPSGGSTSFDQTAISQAALLPFLVSSKDAVLVGEWVSASSFEVRGQAVDDLEVYSFSVPVGWLRQVSPDQQVAAFVMPMGHDSTLDGSSWQWEAMAGVFSRHLSSDSFWWVWGLFADVGPGDDIYLPYLGGSWSPNEHWTFSAILPWPAILFAPNDRTLFRLGLAPSGTSWHVQGDGANLSFDLDTLDLGFAVERRILGGFWLQGEAGVGGLRGLRVSGGKLEGGEFRADPAPYLSIGLFFRPSIDG